jgi:hypothetical protein
MITQHVHEISFYCNTVELTQSSLTKVQPLGHEQQGHSTTTNDSDISSSSCTDTSSSSTSGTIQSDRAALLRQLQQDAVEVEAAQQQLQVGGSSPSYSTAVLCTPSFDEVTTSSIVSTLSFSLLFVVCATQLGSAMLHLCCIMCHHMYVHAGAAYK